MRFTPNGVAFTEQDVTPGDDPARVWVANHIADESDVTLAVVVHGWGGSVTHATTEPLLTFSYGCVDRGWVMASPHLSGDQWANHVAMTDLSDLFAWADARWNVTRVVLHGTSAGALAVAVAIGRDVFPVPVLAVLIDGVLNPQNWYGSGSTRKESVDAAWGTTTLAEYQALLPGYDPINDPATNWAGVPMFIAASTGDTVVSKTRHSDAFTERLAPADYTYTITSGGHVVPANFLHTQALTWLDARVPPYSGGTGGGIEEPPPPASGSSNLRATDGSPVLLRSTAGDVVSLSPA